MKDSLELMKRAKAAERDRDELWIALAEVVRISDRDHVAWDAAKALLAKTRR